MTEIINKNEVSAINSSLSPKDIDSFNKLKIMNNVDSMKSAVSNDERLSKLVKTHFKQENIKSLNVYSQYWVNVASLQQSLIDYWFDLWDYWADWDFWTYTFLWILSLQKSLWQKPTWVVDLKQLKYIFPHTFRSFNKKEKRDENQTKEYVIEMKEKYDKSLWAEKKAEVLNTQKETSILKEEVLLHIEAKKKKIKKSVVEKQADTTELISKSEIPEIEEIKAQKKKKKNEIVEPEIPEIEEIKAEKKKKKYNVAPVEGPLINNKAKSLPFMLSRDAEIIWKTTYCSRTAREHLADFWVPQREIKQWISASASMKLYWNRANYVDKISKLPENANVLDIYSEWTSSDWHRASAFLNGWQFYVLDPYYAYPSNAKDRRTPIPLEEYLDKREIKWVYALSVG